MTLFNHLWGQLSPSPRLDRPLGKGNGALRGEPLLNQQPGEGEQEALQIWTERCLPGALVGTAGSPASLAVHGGGADASSLRKGLGIGRLDLAC